MNTVRTHLSIAIQKLIAHNRMEDAHLAKEKGDYNTRGFQEGK